MHILRAASEAAPMLILNWRAGLAGGLISLSLCLAWLTGRWGRSLIARHLNRRAR